MASKYEYISWDMDGATNEKYRDVLQIIMADDFKVLALQKAGPFELSRQFVVHEVVIDQRFDQYVAEDDETCPKIEYYSDEKNHRYETTKDNDDNYLIMRKDTVYDDATTKSKIVFVYFLVDDSTCRSIITYKKVEKIFLITSVWSKRQTLGVLLDDDKYIFNGDTFENLIDRVSDAAATAPIWKFDKHLVHFTSSIFLPIKFTATYEREMDEETFMDQVQSLYDILVQKVAANEQSF